MTTTLRQGSPTKSRLVSLDAFRGITIAGMLLVNNPGSWNHVYPALEHAEWHGWTPTDLVFPFFLFIVGVAMTFSFPSRLAKGETRAALLKHVIFRSVALFVLGMILTGFPDYDFSHRLILDVLQRIGVVYLFSGIMVIYAKPMQQAVLSVFFIALYWVLMMTVPVPGFGAGVLAPGGNLWQHVDNVLIAGWHYHAEGVLSLIPSFSTVLLGSLTGELLRSEKTPLEKVSLMFVLGNVGMVLGAIMDIWFPINKLLWSSSYVVFTAGFALNLLGVCYWLIDIKHYKSWATPFVVFGVNPIAAFFLSSFFSRVMGMMKIEGVDATGIQIATGLKSWLYANLFASWATEINASMFYAIAYTLMWLGVMWVLYRKNVFVKI
ncbi:MAG: DUF5009 domain-containing protein [Ignavibacteriae bacterium]|nr:DUF5009 domain-containing protein [Ignavibacteriota bacterium]